MRVASFLEKIKLLSKKIPEPIYIFVLCLLTYGLLVPWLGFYLDDWYIVLFQKYFGAGDFSLFFVGDRPLFGYIYQFFMGIFRDSKLAWQIFAVLSHALASIVFWWLLVKILPKRRKLAFVASLFFMVYPGFKFHWFAVMYSQAYILYTIYFFSFIFMIDAVRKERGRFWFTLLAVVCLIIGIVPQEDFFGLELIRPIVLWIVLSETHPTTKERLKLSLLKWIPYLIIVIGFTLYRVGFTSQYSYKISLLDELQTYPIQTILRLIGEVFWSTLDAIVNSWTSTIQILNRNLLTNFSIALILLVLVGIFLSILSLNKYEKSEEQEHSNRWIILIGLLATITSMIPFVVGSFKINLDFPNNRYLYAMAPGASLFLAGAIDSLLRSNRQKVITIGLLIGFAMGSQFLTARSFMLSWKAQQDFFWQMTWRIPDLQKNTILITEDLPFSQLFSGSSLTGPLNLTYANNLNSHNIPYLFVVIAQQENVIPDMREDQPVESNFRSFEFNGNTSSMIVFHQPSVGCFRVLSPSNSAGEFLYSRRMGFWNSAIPLSNLDQIITNPETPKVPPQEYFGRENQDQWCFYFEKADLARQQQQWNEVIQWYGEAQEKGYKPLTDAEWLPLVDAYLNQNDLQKALEITNLIDDLDKTNTAGFCNLWSNQKGTPGNQQMVDDALHFLRCKR